MGFTVVELLVAMSILVIAFGLVTYLYTKAARVRKVVVVHSEIQQVLSQMISELAYGEQGRWAISGASRINAGSTDSQLNCSGTYNGIAWTMNAAIDDDGQATIITHRDASGPLSLDPEKNIALNSSLTTDPLAQLSGRLSMFEYFDASNNPCDPENATFVRITLWAASTDPSMNNAPPVSIITGVKLANRVSFAP